MEGQLILTILGCAVVTFLPRFLPFLIQNLRLPMFWDRFLRLMPVAALGALLVPAAWESLPQAPWAALAGILAAGIWGFFRGGLIVPVLLALGVTLGGMELSKLFG